MNKLQQQWLGAVPWESVVQVNQALCRDKQLEPGQNSKTCATARQLWEKAIAQNMTLKEVLDVARRCHELSPFTFNNGNTFSAVAKTLLEDLARHLNPMEAQILRTTVGHYVVGLIDKSELLEVLRHFDSKLKMAFPAAPVKSVAHAAQSTLQAG